MKRFLSFLFILSCSLINDTSKLELYCDPNSSQQPCPQGYVCRRISEEDEKGKCVPGCKVSPEYDKDQDGYPSPEIETEKGCENFCKINLQGEYINCDCDDNDPTVYPKAIELCDKKDNDCNNLIDEDFDRDGDQFFDCKNNPDCFMVYSQDGKCDCNDFVNTVNPNGVEICNGIDDDCDGEIDEDENLCPEKYFCAGIRGCLLEDLLCKSDEDCPNITEFMDECPLEDSCVCVEGVCYPKRNLLGEECNVEEQCKNIGLHCLSLDVSGIPFDVGGDKKICTRPCCNHNDCGNEGFCLKGGISLGICVPKSWINDTNSDSKENEEICGDSFIRTEDLTFGYSVDGAICSSGYCAFSGSLCDYYGIRTCSICVEPCCSRSENCSNCNFIYQDAVKILFITINIPVHIDIIDGNSLNTNNYPAQINWGSQEITSPITACIENYPEESQLIPCCSSDQCPENMVCSIKTDENLFLPFYPIVCLSENEIDPAYRDKRLCCDDSDCEDGESCLPESIGVQYIWICKPNE